MKKTFTININGLIFNIEEDAYEVLHKYLLNLKHHFGDDEEGREIIADIEARISEIFSEKSSDDSNVITIERVNQMIAIMGTPEDFAKDREEDSEIPEPGKSGIKRLYRDPEHRIIGGICGGLGAYFNMDPLVLRILFVVLTIVTSGTGLLAYIILWIAVPKAKTTAQRLEMKGREATVKNIEKSVREDIKEGYSKYKAPGSDPKEETIAGEKNKEFNSVFAIVLKIIVALIGSVLIISGFFGLLGLISSLAIGHSFVNNLPLIWSPELQIPDILKYFVEPGTITLGIIAVGFLAGIPLLALLFIGTKMVIRYKSNNAAIILSMIGLWIIALLFLIILSTGQMVNYKNRSSVVTSTTLRCEECNTFYLKMANDKYEGYEEPDLEIDNFRVKEIDGNTMLLGLPRLDIEKAGGKSFVVTVRKIARGKSGEAAKKLAEEIIYNFEESDSLLIFEPFFLIDKNDKWRDQKVEITVKVPEGKAVFLDEGLADIIYDIENVSNTWDKDMVGKIWDMKPEGLAMKQLPETVITE
jgi:phage shock protein PspC (stress-responsive transcriptional regulator)